MAVSNGRVKWEAGFKKKRNFPGTPLIKTPCFHCRGMSSIPGPGTKIPHATRYGQKVLKKEKLA